jgi:hypothetical protein
MENFDCTSYITLTGIITALEWDKDDNVIAIGLSTSDEEEYVIEDNSFTDELLDLLYEPVKLIGFVNTNEYGYKSIFVESYELLEEDESCKNTERNMLKT